MEASRRVVGELCYLFTWSLALGHQESHIWVFYVKVLKHSAT
jgi:hypothetical protein